MTQPRETKQNALNVAYGAAIFLSLGVIVLAEDQAGYPSAVLISWTTPRSNVILRPIPDFALSGFNQSYIRQLR